MLTLETFEALLEPRGQAALVAAMERGSTQATLLADVEALRREYGAELAAAATEMALLRARASAKFSRAAEMYFTRDALEQATAEEVARHRAGRYADAKQVWDLGCSIGGDALQFALAGPQVIGLDVDALRLRMAACNADAYGVDGQVRLRQADVLAWDMPAGATIFCDPARRRGGRRVFDPEMYQPPLSIVERWMGTAAGIGVKVAPGIDYDALPWQDCEVEVISLDGEVKETVLWFGALARGTRTATLLPSGVTLTAGEVGLIAAAAPQAYLYEPDGAVIRAHLVEHLAMELGATKIDEDIAFLTTAERVTTPFARAWRIDEVMPFNLKRLRHWLRERNIGRVVVKKRGSPIDPQALERQLRLTGTGTAVVVLTHVLGKPSVLICDVTG